MIRVNTKRKEREKKRKKWTHTHKTSEYRVEPTTTTTTTPTTTPTPTTMASMMNRDLPTVGCGFFILHGGMTVYPSRGQGNAWNLTPGLGPWIIRP